MAEPQLEQQIAQLERQLAEKRQQLEQPRTDKELLHETVGEKIQEQMPAYQSSPSPAPVSGTPVSDAPAWQDPAISQQVQSLVNIAFTKSLDEAIAEAVKTGNAAIIDAFHDLLRDELMVELEKRGKIDPPPK